MSDEALDTAIAALADAQLSGRAASAEELLRKAALRRRLERAARGSAALDKGQPAMLATVCVAAGVLTSRLLSADQSHVFSAAIWLTLFMLASSAAAAAVALISRR
jgi:hypothetical protein